MNRAKPSMKKIEEVGRRLTNPSVRIALRSDFPNLIDMSETALLPRIEAELAKQGQTLESVGEINLVCPQKDPDVFPDHRNPAHGVFRLAVKKLRGEIASRKLGKHAPKVVVQDAICELVHLDRSSGRGGVLHSLTRQQVFNINAQRHARHKTSFLSHEAARKPHYFVVVDWHVSQGTTVANLASYITHNGGHVLAIACLFNSRSLLPLPAKITVPGLPENLDWLAPEFAQPENSARTMAAIGYLLAKSGYRNGHTDIKVNTALRDVERALNRHGHSLKAMTQDEALRLFDNLQSNYLDYDGMMTLETRKVEEKALLRKVAR